MTQDTSIEVRLKLDGVEDEQLINYTNAGAALADKGIRGLMEDDLVTKCVIERQGQRLAGLPHMTWKCFEEALDLLKSKGLSSGSV